MKNTTIGKIQIVLGVVFLVLVLFGGFYVINYEILGSFGRAMVGVTENWGHLREESNITFGTEMRGMMTGQITGYGLMTRIGMDLAVLICLNGLIMSCLLITQGLKNTNQKK